MTQTVALSTHRRECFVDISREVREAIQKSGVTSGLCTVYIPHTTAGVTINENADPDVVADILTALGRQVPNTGFAHMEGNSDAHTKASMMGFSAQLIIENGDWLRGRWQGIYFCEFDGPRNRKVHIGIVSN